MHLQRKVSKSLQICKLEFVETNLSLPLAGRFFKIMKFLQTLYCFILSKVILIWKSQEPYSKSSSSLISQTSSLFQNKNIQGFWTRSNSSLYLQTSGLFQTESFQKFFKLSKLEPKNLNSSLNLTESNKLFNLRKL